MPTDFFPELTSIASELTSTHCGCQPDSFEVGRLNPQFYTQLVYEIVLHTIKPLLALQSRSYLSGSLFLDIKNSDIRHFMQLFNADAIM